MEQSNHDLIWGTILEFTWSNWENSQNTWDGHLGQYLNIGTSWIWRKNAIHSATTYDDCLKDYAELAKRKQVSFPCSFNNIRNIYLLLDFTQGWHACMFRFWNYWTCSDEKYRLLGRHTVFLSYKVFSSWFLLATCLVCFLTLRMVAVCSPKFQWTPMGLFIVISQKKIEGKKRLCRI